MKVNKVNVGELPPVKKGDIMDLKCMSIGKKGDGIFKVDNFVIIAPGVEIGKTYKLKITSVLPNIGFATVMQNIGKVEEKKKKDEPITDTPIDSEDFGEEGMQE